MTLYKGMKEVKDLIDSLSEIEDIIYDQYLEGKYTMREIKVKSLP